MASVHLNLAISLFLQVKIYLNPLTIVHNFLFPFLSAVILRPEY